MHQPNTSGTWVTSEHLSRFTIQRQEQLSSSTRGRIVNDSETAPKYSLGRQYMSLADAVSYVIDGLKRGWNDPYWWRGRIFDFLISPVHTNVYPGRKGSVRVVEEDWDTLVVLDACREDLYRERAQLDSYDQYRTVKSRGSTTREWVRQNFTGGSFGDVVYVTANPYVSREAGDAFHELYEPWLTEFDEDQNTVMPEVMGRWARRAHEEHPNKRVIVHFMQPHHPFITAPDLQFDGWQVESFDEWDSHKDEHVADDGSHRSHTPWEALYRGSVSKQDVWEAYGDNLDAALETVDELLEDVDGKVVITSDHGNMLGERTYPIPLRVYGHPKGIRNEELVTVPWAEITNGERRTVRDGGVESVSESEKDELQDRLADLGYVS